MWPCIVLPYPFQAKSWNGDDVVLVGSVTTPLSQNQDAEAVDDSPSPEAAAALAVAPGALALIRHEEDRSVSGRLMSIFPFGRMNLYTLIASVGERRRLRAEFDLY